MSGRLTPRGRSIPLGRSIFLAVTVSAVMTIAHECSSSEPHSQESTPHWQEATTASGNYLAMFPGKPTAETRGVGLNDLSFTDDRSTYSLIELSLNGVPPDPLDVAVDKTIEGGRAELELEPGWGSATTTELARSTGDFYGTETRRYTDEVTADGHKILVEGLIFCRNDIQVQALVISDGSADAERFLSSVRPAELAQDKVA